MASKKNEVKKEEGITEPSKVYDLDALWEMKFRDHNGTICMVRKAFKPRGKLEFYQPFSDEK